MKRQLDDYYDKFYNKEAKRFKKLAANNYQLAKDIALWKENVAERWDSIKLVSASENTFQDSETGVEKIVTYVIDEAGLNDAIGLELVSIKNEPTDEVSLYEVRPFKMVKKEGNLHTFELKFRSDHAGSFKACVRMFPKNDNLPHRQDFAYVKWLD
jgi:starch phosphorylase